jgi:predicted nucleic acid-binding protein
VRRLLADTGPLVAWFNRRDSHHARAAAFFGGYRGLLLSTWPVVSEVCHLVPPHVAVRFLQWVSDDGMRLVDVPDGRKKDVALLVERYADQPMDVADATLVWLAEEAAIYDIVTVDRTDFAVYRTASGKRLHNRFT